MYVFHSDVTVIGVAGSWGKTTAKETIVALARSSQNLSHKGTTTPSWGRTYYPSSTTQYTSVRVRDGCIL